MSFIHYFTIHRNKLVLSLMLASLVACDDGPKDNNPDPRDKVPPQVIATTPSSEQTNYSLNKIVVLFDEPITFSKTNGINVFIQQYRGSELLSEILPLEANNGIYYDSGKQNLIIFPAVPFQVATKYRVTIRDIVDGMGNKMPIACAWDFATIKYGPITAGNKGVCGTDISLTGVPGAPQNVIAAAADGSVSVTWTLPVSGGEVLKFKLYKLVNDSTTPIEVDLEIAPTQFSFTDGVNGISVVNDSSYVYQLIANNSFGDSLASSSNRVTPQNNITVPGAVLDLIAIANDSSVTIKWEAPLLSALNAASYYKIEQSIDKAAYIELDTNFNAAVLSFTNAPISNGSSYRYRITAGNSVGLSTQSRESVSVIPRAGIVKPIQVINSKFPDNGNQFGSVVAVSPDGLVLAVAEPYGDPDGVLDAGRVELYQKITASDQNWTWFQTLTSMQRVTAADPLTSATGLNYNFGSSLAFDSSSSLLAVGEKNAQVGLDTLAGKVQIFEKTASTVLANAWGHLQTLTSQTPTQIQTSNMNNKFGASVAFSPNSNILAVGETNGDSTAQLNVGILHLFSLIPNSKLWQLSQRFGSQPGRAGGRFAELSIVFSPDGNTIAVGEHFANVQTFNQAGSVTLLMLVQPIANLQYTIMQTLVSNSIADSNQFGNSLAFNHSGTILAVGESAGELLGQIDTGTVQLFTQDVITGNWIYSDTLSEPNLTAKSQNGFGHSIAFRGDDQQIAIAVIRGDISESNGTINNGGTVEIFNYINDTVGWAQFKTLNSQLPKFGSRFGANIVYMPIAQQIIIGESIGSTTIQKIGVVNIFDTTQIP